MQQALDKDTRPLLPLLHEMAQLIWLGKPKDRMDMIWHHHKANASGRLFDPLRIQHPKNNLLGSIVIEQPTTSVTRKRDEVGIKLVVVNSLSWHACIFNNYYTVCKPLVLAAPRQQSCLGHPRWR